MAFHQIWRELRQGLRRLAATPLFTVFSIATLALAIGITTATYTVIERLLDREMGVDDPDALVDLRRSGVPGSAMSWPDYRDLVEQQRSFSNLAAWAQRVTGIGTSDAASLESVELVSGTYFDTVGGRAEVGRLLSPADDRADAPPVLVLSESVWRSRFSADPSIVGRALFVAGRPVTVVGVVAAGFHGLSGRTATVGFWIPLSLVPQIPGVLGSATFDPENRRRAFVRLAGRVEASFSIEQASEDVALIGERLDDTYPPPSDVPSPFRRRNWSVGPAFPPRTDLGNAMWTVILLPAMVFLIACTNVASLALSRGISRRNAIAVRHALGAPRWRLVREEMAESTILAVIGGLAGVAVARTLLATGLELLQSQTAMPPFLLPLDLAISSSIAVPIVTTTVLSLVVGGLLPALQLSRASVRHATSIEANTSVARWRGRRRLIALQVAASVGLFLTAFAASRALTSFRWPDQGPPLHGLAVATIPFEPQQYDEARAREVVDRLIADLQRTPGVRAAAGAAALVRGAFSSYLRTSVTTPDRPFTEAEAGVSLELVVATPGVFQMFGRTLIAGRSFAPEDIAGAPRVAVIDEPTAHELFGSSLSAIGQSLLVRIQSPSRATHDATVTIVGIVPAGRTGRSGEPIKQVYLPFGQTYDPNVMVLAQAAGGPPVAALQETLRRVAPGLATAYVGDGAVLTSTPQRVFGTMTVLGSGLAAFALVLSMAGLYGVLSHVVAKRTRELAVRSALGATAGRIERLVLRDGLRPVLEGLAFGLAGAMLFRQILRVWVIDNLSPIDPAAFGLATLLLIASGLVACFVPARRAARVDPNVALKEP